MARGRPGRWGFPTSSSPVGTAGTGRGSVSDPHRPRLRQREREVDVGRRLDVRRRERDRRALAVAHGRGLADALRTAARGRAPSRRCPSPSSRSRASAGRGGSRRPRSRSTPGSARRRAPRSSLPPATVARRSPCGRRRRGRRPRRRPRRARTRSPPPPSCRGPPNDTAGGFWWSGWSASVRPGHRVDGAVERRREVDRADALLRDAGCRGRTSRCPTFGQTSLLPAPRELHERRVARGTVAPRPRALEGRDTTSRRRCGPGRRTASHRCRRRTRT